MPLGSLATISAWSGLQLNINKLNENPNDTISPVPRGSGARKRKQVGTTYYLLIPSTSRQAGKLGRLSRCSPALLRPSMSNHTQPKSHQSDVMGVAAHADQETAFPRRYIIGNKNLQLVSPLPLPGPAGVAFADATWLAWFCQTALLGLAWHPGHGGN